MVMVFLLLPWCASRSGIGLHQGLATHSNLNSLSRQASLNKSHICYSGDYFILVTCVGLFLAPKLLLKALRVTSASECQRDAPLLLLILSHCHMHMCGVSVSENTVGQTKRRMNKWFSAVCRQEVEGEAMHSAGAWDVESLHCLRSTRIVPPAAVRTAPFSWFGEKWWHHLAFRGRRSAGRSLLWVQ